MSTNTDIDSVHKNLLFVYEQISLLWDACNQLQKDNEFLRSAVDTLLKDALRRKFREEREELAITHKEGLL